jgi:cell wall-associated NlpC family hydrolase
MGRKMSAKGMALLRWLLLGSLLLLLAGCGSIGDKYGVKIPSGPRGKAVTAVLEEIGTPYTYGGSKPGKGLDCSGLTQYAHKKAGLQIPRVSRVQQAKAKTVKLSRAKPGDLVFFRIKGDDHVGMVVDRRRFVHASSGADQVQLATFTDAFWRKHMTGVGTYFR